MSYSRKKFKFAGNTLIFGRGAILSAPLVKGIFPSNRSERDHTAGAKYSAHTIRLFRGLHLSALSVAGGGDGGGFAYAYKIQYGTA